MGSSLILTGGAAVAKTLKETVTQTGHGFTVGNAIRWDQTAATPKYVLAQADSAANAEVAGVVNTISDSNNFEVTYHGYIDLPEFSGISAPVMFLSSTVPGGLTHTPPSAVGTVVKPVLTRNTSGSGHLVMNYLGTQIGGSSTISVDEIQPVGTIMPFAGNAIPDTWLECDGNSYAIASYPQLYAKLQNSSGDRVPAYGYVATLTGTNVSGVLAAGDYIQYKTDTVAWTGTGSPFAGSASNAALLALVLSVTSTTAVVQVLPIYSSTTKNFTISNTIFGGGGFVGSENGTGNYRAYTSASAFKAVSLTITGAAITHFNTPDLRGRFALGVNAPNGIGELETDSFVSAISGNYPLGSEGGQEFVVATPVTIKSAATGTDVNVINNIGASSNIANIPPYTVVRYIIKAKPYTRAAIIDGIDLPYSSLLVRDLRSRNVGGSNGDLGIYTNTPGDAGNGTLRAVFTQGGTFAIGNAVSSSSVNDNYNFVLKHNGKSEIALVKADASGVDTGVSLRCYSSRGTVAVPLAVQSGDVLSRISGFGWDGTIYGNLSGVGGRNGGFNVVAEEAFTSSAHGTALSFEFTPRGRTAGAEGMRFTSDSRLGIGTATPGASLDVNGTLKHKNPAFLANTLTADIVSTKQINYTTLVFSDTAINDTYNGVNVYNATTGVFTAPITGRYYFSARILFAHSAGSWRTNATDGGGGFYIAKNFGTASAASIGPAAVTPNETSVGLVHVQVNADGYANLTAGDTVRVVYYGKPYNQNHNCFGGIFIG